MNNKKEYWSKYYGLTISKAVFVPESTCEKFGSSIFISFASGVSIKIFDDGQSCCERRYMTIEDDLNSLVGFVLTKIEVRDGGSTMDKSTYKDGDIEFLEITTSGGHITIANHNVHNGSYGGFDLVVKEVGV